MAKRKNGEQDMARDAAERIAAAEDVGAQLSLGLDAASGDQVPADAPPRGSGKKLSQMRRWLARQGYRMPEDQLARIAGLHAPGASPMVAAMAQAEEVLAWAYQGSCKTPGPGERLAVFNSIAARQVRAAEAMLPYGLAKVTPDQVNVDARKQVIIGMAAPMPQRADGSTSGGPPQRPPMKNEQNQQVDDAEILDQDGHGRTDDASD